MEVTAEEFNGEKRLEIINELVEQGLAEMKGGVEYDRE
jgi:hypothetical protein